ncbi:radical SAM protein [bacterium]|nr:MAG: radical SAM protein [bacterium]
MGIQITFIDPPALGRQLPVERVFGCTYSLYPIPNIFSLSAAAVLEKAGFRVNYIDMANERWGLNRVSDFFKKDDSRIYVFHSVNLSLEPDLKIHRLIRKSKENTAIVFTGPGPTYFIDYFLRDKNTFVARGEPELTLLELARALSNNLKISDITGLSFKDGERVINNPPRRLVDNLDELPFPARHLLKKDLYYNPKLAKLPFSAMQTSRNCSYRCMFCVPNSYNFARELEHRNYNQNNKPPVRMRSAENVICEFELLKNEGYRSISIIDDQFLWDDPRTISICEGIKGLGIEWGCLARVDRINENLASELASSGCKYVDLGVESFNQEVLDDARKDLKVEKIPEAISILKRNKILVKINLVLGISPLQTVACIKRDIRLARHLDVDAVMFSLATPFPGTDFYQRAKENHWFVKDGYHAESVQCKGIINYPGLSYRKLNQLVRLANLSFYFHPRFVFKNLKRLADPIGFYRSIVALKRKFF